MSNINEVIVDNFPPVSGQSIPLGSTISVTFNTLMDTTISGLQSTLFVEGPDTDQFVGPGLLEQQFPPNVSQGPLSDFLMSPGYQGIVQGVITTSIVSGLTVSGIPYTGTQAVFTPSQPLAPSTTYTVHITQTHDSLGNVVSGYVDWSFETGTGSIVQLPNTISTSVLAEAFRAPGLAPASQNLLQVVSITPGDHSVQNSPELQDITITFDKVLDPNSITSDMITINTEALTSHPDVKVNAQGSIAFNMTVSGNIIKLSI
jgi:hypothetical protein